MSKIEANVSGVQGITARVVGDGIVATVSGVGPQGPSGTGTWEQIEGKPTEFPPSEHPHVIGDVTGLQSALDSKQAAGSYVLTTDASVTNAREWSAATVSKIDAETGTSTDRKAFSPLRVFQAIAAWWAGSAAKAKLDGIATGATANATDAQLRDRATHTGYQTAATISDFTTAVIAAAPPTTNASLLTSGTLPDARLSSNIARTSDVTSAVAAVVDASPASLDTLRELAQALGDDANFSATVTNALAAKAPINNPTFTGTVSGVTKAMVGLGNADNTSDALKPVSTAQAAADAAVASAAAADATTKANAARDAAVQRSNHTGTQDASTIGSGTLNFSRLPFTVTYPVRAVHAAGVLSFNNWAVYTTPTYFWGGSAGDLRTLATMEYPATSVSVDVSASATKYIADNPGRTLTYAALEVVLVDAANRIVGWGTTSTNAATGPSNGTGGTSMTLSLFSFPAVSAANWVIGGLPAAGNVTDITPITAYKLCQSRHLDLDRTDWGNIPNKPTFAEVSTSGSAADLTGTLNAARLPSTAVTAGSYGSASSVGTFTVDATGRLTAAGSTAIAISAGAVSGLATVATSGSYADLSNKPTLFSGAYSSLTGVPTTFAPSAHKSSHATGGSDAISPSDIGAASASHTQAWSTITSTPTTLSGYGITDGVTTSDTRLASNGSKGDITVSGNGATWTINAGAVVTADIADSAVTTAKLANAAVTVAKVSATGTPSASNFLRGDGAWATPTASVSAATTTTLGGVIVPASSGLSVDGSGNISAAFATNAQALAGASALVSAPSAVQQQMARWRFVDMGLASGAVASGGLGDVTQSEFRAFSQATAGGSSVRSANSGIAAFASPANTGYASGEYWAKRQVFAFRANATVGSANGVVRMQFGKSTTTLGRLTGRGIGLEWYFISAVPFGYMGIRILAHNGTSLTVTDTGITVMQTAQQEYMLVSDGAGNVTVTYNDGSLVNTPVAQFTATGGPTSGPYTGITAEASNGGDTQISAITCYRYIFGTSY